MMEDGFDFFVGIDWASEKHDVCVVDRQGKILVRRTIQHSGRAITELADWLLKLAEDRPERLAVGIEMTRGALVDMLCERQIAVYSLNPKQLDRFRDRHSVAGAKDDDLDAYVLGNSLRTDRALYRKVSIDPELVIELREMSRMWDDLVEERGRLANRLREQVYRYFPQMLALCPAADEPWFWALIERVPTPAAATSASTRRIAMLLRKFRIRRISADEVLAQLRTPPVRVAPGTQEAARAHIAFLLPRLHLVDQQCKENKKRQEELLEKIAENDLANHDSDDPDAPQRAHSDVDIILSVPGIGVNFAATMLAEASAAIRERDHDALRTRSGAAPVTRRSGKRKSVTRRYARNTRLAQALHHAARVHAQRDPQARERYAAQRARGLSHGRALRSIGDRLLRVLSAMLRDNTLWVPGHQRQRTPLLDSNLAAA